METPFNIEKARLFNWLNEMPEYFSFDQLMEKITFHLKVEAGRQLINNGHIITVEESDIKVIFAKIIRAHLQTLTDFIDPNDQLTLEDIKNIIVTEERKGSPGKSPLNEELSKITHGYYQIIYQVISDKLIHVIAVNEDETFMDKLSKSSSNI